MVGRHVFIEVSLTCKPVGAEGAAEWFFPRVLEHVGGHMTRRAKHLPALWAWIVPGARVGVQVLTQ